MALLPGIRKHLQQCNREHRLLLVRLRLLRRKERPNRDLTRFTAQIQALIDRWEK